MAALKYNFIAVVTILCSCASIAKAIDYKIEIDNQLGQCIAISNANIEVFNEIPMLKLKYKELKLTADCGCKSAISSYYVYSMHEQYNSFLIGGKVSFNKGGEILLPAATSSSIIGSNKIKVNVSCASPD